MGRIKSKLIKRTAKELHARIDNTSTSFEDNKKLLGSTMPSKKLKNKIAGYLVRLEKQKRRHAQTLEASVQWLKQTFIGDKDDREISRDSKGNWT